MTHIKYWTNQAEALEEYLEAKIPEVSEYVRSEIATHMTALMAICYYDVLYEREAKVKRTRNQHSGDENI